MKYTIDIIDAFHNGYGWQEAPDQFWDLPAELDSEFESADEALDRGVKYATQELRRLNGVDGYDDDSAVLVWVRDENCVIVAREIVTMEEAMEDVSLRRRACSTPSSWPASYEKMTGYIIGVSRRDSCHIIASYEADKSSLVRTLVNAFGIPRDAAEEIAEIGTLNAFAVRNAPTHGNIELWLRKCDKNEWRKMAQEGLTQSGWIIIEE